MKLGDRFGAGCEECEARNGKMGNLCGCPSAKFMNTQTQELTSEHTVATVTISRWIDDPLVDGARLLFQWSFLPGSEPREIVPDVAAHFGPHRTQRPNSELAMFSSIEEAPRRRPRRRISAKL